MVATAKRAKSLKFKIGVLLVLEVLPTSFGTLDQKIFIELALKAWLI